MTQFDLRTNRPSGIYKGPSGSIRSIAVHKTENYVGVTGLDRFIRIFNITTKEQITKSFIKIHGNSLLFTNEPFQKEVFDFNLVFILRFLGQ